MKATITTCNPHGLSVGDCIVIDQKGRPRWCPRWAYRLWRKVFKLPVYRVTLIGSKTTFTVDP